MIFWPPLSVGESHTQVRRCVEGGTTVLASAVTRGAERDGEDASPARRLLRCVVNVERHPSKLLMQVHRRRGRARVCGACVCHVCLRF